MTRHSTAISRAALAGAVEYVPEPIRLEPLAQPLGDSASQQALKRLTSAIKELGDQEMPKLLNQAIRAINQQDYQRGESLALAALNIDERQGIAWHVLAVAREKLGDLGGSLRCYDAALKLLPEDTVVALDIGRLAMRLGMPDFAIRLYKIALEANPNSLEAANNMGTALRDLARYDEAVDLLKPALLANAESPMLWNTLGTVMKSKGDLETARLFFDEAVRLKPDFALAYHNRGGARADLGDLAGALSDCDTAMANGAKSIDFDNMRFSKACVLLALGELEEGWRWYEARLTRGHAGSARFVANAPCWAPGDDVAGKHIVVFCEQGVGDEVMFACLLPDLIDAVGAEGRVTLICERRLQALFQRSFPTCRVLTHRTVKLEGRITRGSLDIETWDDVDFWVPAASLLQEYRTGLDKFYQRGPHLTPDPERVAYWRGWLQSLPNGPKIGILWKSGMVTGERTRFYSPFGSWDKVLTTPGAVFVNIQYGDCEEEVAYARDVLGVEIVQPPGIDLKADLDDLAALTSALDLVMGTTNATTQLAGGAGAPIWIIGAKWSWTQLGTDHYPWLPQARCFAKECQVDWSALMGEVAAHLAAAIRGEASFSRLYDQRSTNPE